MTSDLSWPLAVRLMNASACAYQIRDAGVASASAKPISRTAEGDGGAVAYDVVPDFQDAVGFEGASQDYTPAFTAVGPDRIDAALCGLTHDGYALVSFRGTLPPNDNRNDLLEWIKDWMNDADALQTRWPPSGPEIGKVEAGFADSVVALWPWVETQLASLLPKAPKGLLITGHSKGAGMTFLAAHKALLTWPDLAGRIGVYAFAAPVVGDAAFRRVYSGLLPVTHRFQVADDVVPFLPRWDTEDVWSHIRLGHLIEREEWRLLTDVVCDMTGSGYCAVGDMAYVEPTGQVDTAATAASAALTTVVSALEAEDFGRVLDAHSAAESYLPKIMAASSRAIT